ncbi:MAG: pyridoxal phosphate-dependent aminotransferase [Methanobrevibacter sp.]|jgi:cystathionine beta-lyase|nr:pyridoxal phosphate-dependent aminotransferase [Candidatus Methanovirga australis]
MKYDFDKIYDRKNTGCLKWDDMNHIFGKDDLIPLWIADMDFPVAKPIKEAIKNRADHPFYGYTQAKESLLEAVCNRLENKFNWKIDPEWIVFTPGVIPALNYAIRSIAYPGDRIILQEPCYHPFFPTIKNSGCQVVNNQLKLINGRYEIDFDGLRSLFKSESGRVLNYKPIKAIIFCNPHNPVGRVWTKEEITKVGEIALENDLKIISDEIHSEILFNNNKHTSFATISPEFEQNSIVCISPSKTFNIPGLNISSIIIPNDKIRKEFISTQLGLPSPNLFAYTAFEAAFRYCDDWLEEVLEYLHGNLNLLIEYVDKFKSVALIKPEGTYLIWLDFRELNMDGATLNSLLKDSAGVALEEGSIFGESGSGFMRMNIAIPRPLLKIALEKIDSTLKSL